VQSARKWKVLLYRETDPSSVPEKPEGDMLVVALPVMLRRSPFGSTSTTDATYPG
jgi:hypothetical protein